MCFLWKTKRYRVLLLPVLQLCIDRRLQKLSLAWARKGQTFNNFKNIVCLQNWLPAWQRFKLRIFVAWSPVSFNVLFISNVEGSYFVPGEKTFCVGVLLAVFVRNYNYVSQRCESGVSINSLFTLTAHNALRPRAIVCWVSTTSYCSANLHCDTTVDRTHEISAFLSNFSLAFWASNLLK